LCTAVTAAANATASIGSRPGRAAQVVVEEPLVLEDGHDLAVAQRRHLAHHA
jgi:hypothetical protein